MRKLTDEERAALNAFAAQHGRTWKADLRAAWANGQSKPVLQFLRNDPGFGPSGLVRFRVGK